jgi:hypothetical protein
MLGEHSAHQREFLEHVSSLKGVLEKGPFDYGGAPFATQGEVNSLVTHG